MRRLVLGWALVGCVVGALALCGSTRADEPPEPNEPRSAYATVEGGIELGTHEAATFFVTSDTSEGAAVFATLGAFVTSSVNVEAEVGFRKADVSFMITIPSGPHVEQLSIMLNVGYSVPLTEALSFTLGAGAGLDSISVDSASESAFAFQFKGGLDYEIVDTVHIVANYRHMITTADTVGGSFLQVRDVNNSTITVGFGLDF